MYAPSVFELRSKKLFPTEYEKVMSHHKETIQNLRTWNNH